jgi:hypothetical protein
MLIRVREEEALMRHTLLLSALMVLSFNAGWAVAQEKPNFNGAWVMDMTRSESAAQATDAAPRTPVKLDITSSPAALTIRTMTDGRGETVEYTFDTVTRVAVADSRERAESSAKEDRAIDQAQARWDGAGLVTVTVYRVNGMSAKKTETRRLSADGKEMTIETEMQMQHGYESDGKGPAGYGVAKDVYMRDGH